MTHPVVARTVVARTVVARLTAKKATRSGALWGYFFGVCVASSALTYLSSYKTPAERHRLAANFGANTAVSALFGPAHDLQTVAGFTAFKVLGFLSVVGAVWGLLAATRLLRGEEDSGRWELLLSGQTTRRAAATQALLGLGTGLFALFVVTGLVTVLTGLSSKVHFGIGESLFFAVALVSSAAVFLAVGALASQLAATRRQAATYAGYALGACYGLRMVADSGVGLEGLRWATPLGWVELLQPLTAPDWVPLVPLAALLAALAAATVRLAGSRDLGASTFPDHPNATAHTRLLNGPAGLTARLMRPSLTAWAVALAATALIFGGIAKAAGTAISGSTSVGSLLSKLGAHGAGARAYLGVAFLIMAIMLSFVAANQVTATRAEEASGRLEHLLVQPLSRWSWLRARVVEAASVLVVGGLAIGVFSWLGAASGRAGVPFASLVDAGVNIVPPALFVVGTGILVNGTWPRATSVAVYGVIAWSVLVTVIGGFAENSRWLLDTSLFHQMAAAPASAPDWASNGIMITIGALIAVIGGFAFQRRDLAGE
ncbi:MAG: ABC transporter permease subunit [Acidimicrobiales bacterium]